jgi:hypothetical protein
MVGFLLRDMARLLALCLATSCAIGCGEDGATAKPGESAVTIVVPGTARVLLVGIRTATLAPQTVSEPVRFELIAGNSELTERPSFFADAPLAECFLRGRSSE